MAGLIEKDLRLILKRKQTLVLFLGLALLMGMCVDGSFMIGYLTFLSAVYVVGTISYDEFDNGYPFLMTLPIDHRIYVWEKYLFCFLAGAGAWVVALVLYFLCDLLKGIPIGSLSEAILQAAVFIPIFAFYGCYDTDAAEIRSREEPGSYGCPGRRCGCLGISGRVCS